MIELFQRKLQLPTPTNLLKRANTIKLKPTHFKLLSQRCKLLHFCKQLYVKVFISTEFPVSSYIECYVFHSMDKVRQVRGNKP